MTRARIEARFAACAAEGRAAFVAYVMAGDPDAAQSRAILRELPGAGADVIELGFPFSDPMAEGPPIQRASLRALKAGTTLARVLGMVQAFRGDTPEHGKVADLLTAAGGGERRRVDLGPVQPWLIGEARRRGLDISGYVHTMDTDAVRHILKHHGDQKREASRGQVAVTEADLEALPATLNSATDAVFGLVTRNGLPALALISKASDQTAVVVEAVLTREGRLIVRTVWKMPGGAREARLKAVLGQHVRNAPQALDIAQRPPKFNAPPPDQHTPIILMGYLNPVLSYGCTRFAADAARVGVDGLLVVDCPPEEADELADALDREGLALVRLAAPTTDAARLPAVIRRASGFIYHVAVTGVTGGKGADAEVVAPAVARVRAASGLPVAVGFGVRTPEQAAAMARVADAVVVGSALVEAIAEAVGEGADPVERVLARASALARAVREARDEERR